MAAVAAFGLVGVATTAFAGDPGEPADPARNAVGLVRQGQQIFRHGTFGDKVFWGEALQLH